MLYNPTNMAIDPQGRIWIAEGVNYREKLGIRREAGDRIVVLIDSDGDGSADQSKVFWQDPYLESPLGIAVFDNQIVISQPPDIVVLTDVDRNLKFDPSVDKKEVLLTGLQRQATRSLPPLGNLRTGWQSGTLTVETAEPFLPIIPAKHSV